jgi:tetratricopeptide (TPR) repeat protein
MATAPVVALLYDRVFLAPSFAEIARRRWAVYVGLAATWLILLVPVQVAFGLVPDVSGGDGAGFRSVKMTPVEYALSQPGVLLYYLRLVLWPHPLCLDYEWPAAQRTLAIAVPTILVVALLLGTMWALVRRPALGFLGAAFFLILAPTSSIMPIVDLAFEHRMYLPLAAVIVLAVLGADAVLRDVLKVSASGARRIGVLAACLLVAVLGVMTHQRNADYHRESTLWRTVVDVNPDNSRARYNLGVALVREGDPAGAAEQFARVLQVNPDHAEAHTNLGLICVGRGHMTEAIQHYRDALRVNPDHAIAHANLGLALAHDGKLDEAMHHYKEALRINPDYPLAHFALGLALEERGEWRDAADAFAHAVRAKPDYAEALNEWGQVEVRLGRPEEAVSHYEAAVASNPMYAPAYDNLGVAQGLLGRHDEALLSILKAVRLQPMAAKYACDLALAYQDKGQQRAADLVYRQGVSLDPTWLKSLNETAWRLATNADSRFRCGPLAVRLARQTCGATAEQDADFLDTLAAAYAEVHAFDKAVAPSRKALYLLRGSEYPQRLNAVQERLGLYQTGRPYRQLEGKGEKW